MTKNIAGYTFGQFKINAEIMKKQWLMLHMWNEVLQIPTHRKTKSEEKNRDTFKNWPLKEKPHFLSYPGYPYETWWKWWPNEVINFTKSHEDGEKILIFQ